MMKHMKRKKLPTILTVAFIAFVVFTLGYFFIYVVIPLSGAVIDFSAHTKTENLTEAYYSELRDEIREIDEAVQTVGVSYTKSRPFSLSMGISIKTDEADKYAADQEVPLSIRDKIAGKSEWILEQLEKYNADYSSSIDTIEVAFHFVNRVDLDYRCVYSFSEGEWRF